MSQFGFDKVLLGGRGGTVQEEGEEKWKQGLKYLARKSEQHAGQL